MTNTKSFLAKTTAIACLGLREWLELSHVLGVKSGLLVWSYRVWGDFLGAIAFPSQNQLAESIIIGQDGDRLGLAFVSKAERLFRLVQAVVSGVVLLRSYVLVEEGDLVLARWFL
jgi:hypothetical protein